VEPPNRFPSTNPSSGAGAGAWRRANGREG
jgi:hypothetical protein